MPRQPIYFDQEVLARLKNYIKGKYGGRRALSAVVQHAVVKFLNEEEQVSGRKKGQGKPKAL